MEKVILKTKKCLFKENRFLNASLLNFDMPLLIKKMKHSYSWAEGELNTMILLKTPFKQILLTALHEDTIIRSFQSNTSVTFQIIEGKLWFHTLKESLSLDKGQLLTLSENISYSLMAKEETVFLLTIIKGKLQPTVN